MVTDYDSNEQHYSSDLSCRDSEGQVLGGLLRDEELREQYLPLLNADVFGHEPFRQIFNAVKRLTEEKQHIDLYLIIEYFCSQGEHELKAEIVMLYQDFISKSTFAEHVRLITDKARERRICSGINNMIAKGDYSVQALQTIIDNEENHRSPGNVYIDSEKSIKSFLENLNQPIDSFYTGFDTLDRNLHGIRKGTLFVIGARPSTGKTTFALNIARNIAGHKNNVFFYSLEMTADMIYERLSANTCYIPYAKFSANQLDNKDLGAVSEYMNAISDGKHLIVIDNKYTVDSICADIYAEKPDVVVIDYVQRVRALKAFQNTREQINYITSELKIAAKKTGTAVIVLSQIVRAGKDAPTMSNLKESGALEEDGDYIVLLYREYVNDKNEDISDEGRTTLILDKNKFGKCGEIPLYFDLHYQRFTEVSYNYE